MKKSVLSLLTLLSLSISAQKHTNTWYFGDTGAGINFNTCPPTPLTNGWSDLNNPLFEGSTAYSDANGSLLFYSNGRSVFNASHLIMPNGNFVGGGNTQTQNIIVPKPGSNSLYYLFIPQIQAGGGPGVVMYCEVDMTLNAGLGDVILSNAVLRDTVGRRGTEKLTAVKHSNGTDYWLIGHDYYNNKFFCYLITAAGINFVPVETSIGPVITDPVNQSHFPAIGELKASPDGSKLGFTCIGDGLTAIFQFDNSTGIVSNPITLDINDGGSGCYGYGASFSPDNSKFYVNSTVQGLPMGPEIRLFQFDLNNWNSVNVLNSRYTVNAGPIATYYSMKLGPDRKIYMSKGYNSYLAVINTPNASGAACSYTDQGFYLGSPGSWGLNNAIEMFDTAAVNSISVTASSPSVCAGSSVTLFANGSATYSWLPVNNFAGSSSSSIIVTPTITTTYSVSTSNPGCLANTSFSIVVSALPSVTINPFQPTVCIGATVSLSASGGITYTWLPANNFPGSNAAVILVSPTVTTTYTLNASDLNCTASKSFSVIVNSFPAITITASQPTVCAGSTLALTANGSLTYTWLPTAGFSGSNSYSVVVTPTSNTVYFVTASNANCVAGASFSLQVLATPVITISASETTICLGFGVRLTAGGGAGATYYMWNNNSPGNVIFVAPSTTTVYTVMAQNQNGCVGTSSIQILVAPCVGIDKLEKEASGIIIYPNPNNGQFRVTCDSDSQIRIYNGMGQEIINAYNTAGTADINITERTVPGIYFVEVLKNGMFSTQKIVVTR